MLELKLNKSGESPLQLLCLGAHADDIEIGAGGTVLKLIETYPAIEVTWVVFSADQERAREANASARKFLSLSQDSTILVKSHRDSFFPYSAALKEDFEKLATVIDPDIILTHYAEDAHQDHRTICQLTWNTFRSHSILEYEIPKYDGDLGRPNLYVPLDSEMCETKVRHLIEAFPSQRRRHWFTEDVFRSTLRLRGVESGSSLPFAEAFYARKTVLV